ncbi:MAG TPA: hypothetical protein PLT09_10070 [Deltaproteobacteria bacterium]|nr:hypothetical protein [Deltaproteobacteria bacterium]HPR54946.1 hypothetical protein [Deltaproteobacteria bacterium]HXK47779.1 hypothetical protein [Deltaproteobacteria bacterium]
MHLGRLERENFDELQWAALNWVRTYILYEGDFPDSSVDEKFRSAYPLGDQKAIYATLKLMLFFNMMCNMFNRKGSYLLKG